MEGCVQHWIRNFEHGWGTNNKSIGDEWQFCVKVATAATAAILYASRAIKNLAYTIKVTTKKRSLACLKIKTLMFEL